MVKYGGLDFRIFFLLYVYKFSFNEFLRFIFSFSNGDVVIFVEVGIVLYGKLLFSVISIDCFGDFYEYFY